MMDSTKTLDELGVEDFIEFKFEREHSFISEFDPRYKVGDKFLIDNFSGSPKMGTVISANSTRLIFQYYDKRTEVVPIASNRIKPAPKLQTKYTIKGQGPDLMGLANLGNTCYINSIIQAINNTPLLKQFLVSSMLPTFINYQNPAGSQGRIAIEFSLILKDIQQGLNTKQSL